MTRLTAERFPEFFEAITGYQPFRWQVELAERLIHADSADPVPAVIDVPTGLGKTSVVFCWAYALAAQVESRRRSIPLRLYFVVDRRLVVDDAHAAAERLARRLEDARGGSGVVAEVGAMLRSLHDSVSDPELAVVKMRGGVSWEARWLARPDQAAIVVGTVDQFGSRLLFRGYGVSDRMRPVDTALVSIDSWLVVDEAHIAEPLLRTVASAVEYQSLVEGNWGLSPLRVSRMSATPRNSTDVDVFRADLDAEAAASEDARRRLSTRKPVVLVDLPAVAAGASALKRGDWTRAAQELGRAMAELACKLDGGAQVVGVVANTIGAARAAHAELEKRGEQAILLIGRTREFERETNLERWLPVIAVDGERRAEIEGRLFVVATQTIEVGANLDFDAMVTECAPLAALIQRFGRVNRLGRRPERRSLIVHPAFDDPVYGDATEATWQFLRALPGACTVAVTKGDAPEWPLTGESLDLGIRHARKLAADAPDGVDPRPEFVPIALGAHFERWAATSPAPNPDQDVAPFLHGIGRGVPEVFVAWRVPPPELLPDGLDPDATEEEELRQEPMTLRWQQWLALAPPVEWEFVSVPLWEARRLVNETGVQGPVSDVEGAWPTEPDERPGPADRDDVPLGVIYRGPREAPQLLWSGSRLRPGDRLVLRANVGGHDEWGWTGDRGGAPVKDVADFAPTRRRGMLRLSSAVLGSVAPPEAAAGIAQALANVAPDADDWKTPVFEALESAVAAGTQLGDLIRAARGWLPADTGFMEDGRPVLLLAEPRAGFGAEAQSDDDEVSTSQSGHQTPLYDHGRDVGVRARRFAERAGLASPVVRAVELAGRWHDLGKADFRFQVSLHDGDEFAAVTAPALLAKSGRDARDPVARAARRAARLPRGFRHEAVSGLLFDALAAEHPELLEGVDRDLARHLIVSHHGYSRPLLVPMVDGEPPEVEVMVDGATVRARAPERQVDWEQPARFEALCGRYGWWGLAYLESLVRLADMLSSERGPEEEPA